MPIVNDEQRKERKHGEQQSGEAATASQNVINIDSFSSLNLAFRQWARGGLQWQVPLPTSMDRVHTRDGSSLPAQGLAKP